MSEVSLFPMPAESVSPQSRSVSSVTRPEQARLNRPVRNQVEMMLRDIDSLLAEDHPMDEGEVDGGPDPSQQMILGDALFEAELVEQLADRVLPSHHLNFTLYIATLQTNYSTLACNPDGFGNSPRL